MDQRKAGSEIGTRAVQTSVLSWYRLQYQVDTDIGTKLVQTSVLSWYRHRY
jgi:hypothetical protein